MRYHSQFAASIMTQIFLQAITMGDGTKVTRVPYARRQTSVYYLPANAPTLSP